MTPSSADRARTDALGARLLGPRQRTLLATPSIAGRSCSGERSLRRGGSTACFCPSPLEVLEFPGRRRCATAACCVT